MRTMKDSRRGAAMFIALFMVVLVGMGSGAVWVALRQQVDRQSTTHLQDRSQALAQSGLNYAQAKLDAEGSLSLGEVQFPLGEGQVQLNIQQGQEVGQYRIASTGTLDEYVARGNTSTLVGLVYRRSHMIVEVPNE